MRRPVRRLAHTRAAFDSTAVPTWRPPRIATADPTSLHFVLAPGRLAHGRRIYAIGDIHGCLSGLRQLHAAIKEDLARRPTTSVMLIHLGDYIDLGPHSADVVALLASGPPIPRVPTINLMGDHERIALDALSGEAAAATDWLHIGGQAALDSWGVPAGTPRTKWASFVPAAHVAFLQALLIDHCDGDYMFVHAGIRPGMALAHQTDEDKLGVRQSFLASERDFGVIVVHGHSVSPSPLVRPNRIGIDTGAGNGGKLTCAVLEDEAVAFMSVQG